MAKGSIATVRVSGNGKLFNKADADRVCSNIRTDIIDEYKKSNRVRHKPGGRIASKRMWGVEFTTNTDDHATIKISALLDAEREYSRKTPKKQPEPKRYPWLVEYGHERYHPKCVFLPMSVRPEMMKGKPWWRAFHNPTVRMFKWVKLTRHGKLPPSNVVNGVSEGLDVGRYKTIIKDLSLSYIGKTQSGKHLYNVNRIQKVTVKHNR